MSDCPYKPSSFYWVKPVFDVDFTTPEFKGREWDDGIFKAAWAHWSQRVQPAYFEGYVDGNEVWVFLGHKDEEPWPVCWVGDEIVKPANIPE